MFLATFAQDKVRKLTQQEGGAFLLPSSRTVWCRAAVAQSLKPLAVLWGKRACVSNKDPLLKFKPCLAPASLCRNGLKSYCLGETARNCVLEPPGGSDHAGCIHWWVKFPSSTGQHRGSSTSPLSSPTWDHPLQDLTRAPCLLPFLCTDSLVSHCRKGW